MTRWAWATAVAAVCIAVLAGCTPVVAGLTGPETGGLELAQIGSDRFAQPSSASTQRVTTPPPNEFGWTVASVDPSTRDLLISWTDGGSLACRMANRVRVEETPRAVVVGISAPDQTEVCTSEGHPRLLTVHLRAAIGGRALLEKAWGGNDGLPRVATPDALPSPTCSTADGSPSNVPVGMLDVTTRVAPTSATAAFVCRTWWPNGRVRMESTTISDPTKVAALARALNGGTTDVAAGPAAVVPCPTRLRGSWYDVTFKGMHLQVQVHTDEINCLTVTNGGLSGRLSPALAKTLDALFTD